jgi:hypothetical protein
MLSLLFFLTQAVYLKPCIVFTYDYSTRGYGGKNGAKDVNHSVWSVVRKNHSTIVHTIGTSINRVLKQTESDIDLLYICPL